jgi:hypothetical protein
MDTLAIAAVICDAFLFEPNPENQSSKRSAAGGQQP